VPLRLGEGLEPEIIQDQQLHARQLAQQLGVAAIAARHA